MRADGGQAVSSRPDVAPPSYTAELEKLQDQIPPFSSAEAMDVLQAELGCPPSVHFSELSPEPVAAASLGQVRACSLPDAHCGGRVCCPCGTHACNPQVGLCKALPGLIGSTLTILELPCNCQLEASSGRAT